MKRVALRVVLALLVLIAVLAAIVVALNFRDEDEIPATAASFSPTREQVARGEYLARAGNCSACHTARGGAPYAGGRAIATPFGTIYSTNITPDARTGIGTWTPAYFWRAMHNGRSKDGRLLYPAFPYTEYTLITREDSDAIFAYLWSVPAVEQPRRMHELRFPYDNQIALAVWRALFFEPKQFEPDSARPADWNRGAYLVRGLGHCIACHSARNVLGASSDVELSGGLIPAMGWYAPSLVSRDEAGVADWHAADIVTLLKSGASPRGSTMGPMAEVVFRSTQYLSNEDLTAMAAYLKALPQAPPKETDPPWWSWFTGRRTPRGPAEEFRRQGAQIYEKSCAGCHGDHGEGAVGAYPALAGNRAVTLHVPANVIRAVLSGGYLPATAGNPRPYGMPPFSHVLSDEEIAAVLSYIRSAWGNAAQPVSPLEVLQYRSVRGK
ncbi:MAG TPA: cytochrome c [Burkholderiales bacterium]|nr:cytochrome c [Burkholderiales bacterium]